MDNSKLERRFVRPSQISKHLSCTVCTEVFYDPMRLPCEHTFCRDCIQKWLEGNKTCPVCREKASKDKLKRNMLAQNLINEFEVFCVNVNCVWKDRLEHLPNHIQHCELEEKNLPEWIKECENFSSSLENNHQDENDQLQERINQEIPKQSILMRLYNKDSKTRELLKETLESGHSPISNKFKLNIDPDLLDILSDYDPPTENKKSGEKMSNSELILHGGSMSNDLFNIASEETHHRDSYGRNDVDVSCYEIIPVDDEYENRPNRRNKRRANFSESSLPIPTKKGREAVS